MKRLFAVTVLAIAWLAPAPARAGNAIEPDFATIAGRVCDSNKTPAAKQFCAWKPYVNQQLPRQFFAIVSKVDPCVTLLPLTQGLDAMLEAAEKLIDVPDTLKSDAARQDRHDLLGRGRVGDDDSAGWISLGGERQWVVAFR
jgi:hypothetical protein